MRVRGLSLRYSLHEHRLLARSREVLNDPLFWVLVLPGLLLGLYAQGRIKLNFAKYSQVATQGGITGAEVARRLLDSQGLQGVSIESTPGILKDLTPLSTVHALLPS